MVCIVGKLKTSICRVTFGGASTPRHCQNQWTCFLICLFVYPSSFIAVVTVNDYLAQRDAEWMGRVHRFLGLSVGLIQVSELCLVVSLKEHVFQYLMMSVNDNIF